MKYVLIVWIMGGGNALTAIEFHNKPDCEAALVGVKAARGGVVRELAGGVCVEKRLPPIFGP